MDPEDYAKYAGGKLGLAMDVLDGPGPLKRRLYLAYMEHLHVVDPAWLSDGLRQEFEQLREDFTWVPPGPEDAHDERRWNLVATIRAMSEEQAVALADTIRTLHDEYGTV